MKSFVHSWSHSYTLSAVRKRIATSGLPQFYCVWFPFWKVPSSNPNSKRTVFFKFRPTIAWYTSWIRAHLVQIKLTIKNSGTAITLNGHCAGVWQFLLVVVFTDSHLSPSFVSPSLLLRSCPFPPPPHSGATAQMGQEPPQSLRFLENIQRHTTVYRTPGWEIGPS